ncbi:hypothetical protein RUM43_005159 [Polyplax serrata]|uniref:Uncharacterized protein n=1 Tax=Polyplax serrata TaxID=468196 RepID=A0AAN8SCN2_POLSC
MDLHLRWKLCELFAEAVSDESFSVRVKNKYPLRDISSMQQHLSIKTNKNGTKSCYMQLNAERSFRVGGIMFLTDVKNDYHRHWSRNNRSYYFYCPLSTDKFYESEREKGKKVYSEFKDTFQSRKLWLCEADSNLTADEVKRQIEQFSTSVFDKTRKDSK